MRHVSDGLGHGRRHLDIVSTWLRRNAAVAAFSLLVPLVALGALAILPGVLQGVVAPLWRAVAPQPGDVSPRHVSRLHGDPVAPPADSAYLASSRTRVVAANVMGGLPGPSRRARDQGPVSEGSQSAGDQRTKPPGGGAGVTNDDAEPSEGVNGGDGAAGKGGGSGARDETGGGRGNRPGRGNDDGCSAKTPRPKPTTTRRAAATAVETATALAEATAATAASALNSATGAAVEAATPVREAAAAAGADTVGATLAGAAQGAMATIAAPRRR
jgi:hypothetical protein